MILTTEFQKVLEASTKVTQNVTGYLRLYLKYGGRDVANNKDIIYYEIRQYAYNPYGNYLGWEWSGSLAWNIKLGNTVKANGTYTQSAVHSNGKEVLRVSGSWEQPHNADGNWSSDISFDGYVYQTKVSNSGSIILPLIPRASSVSGGSGNIGGTTTINVNRASSSFTHTLEYAFGNLTGTIATGVGTSHTWTIPTSFYTQIPNSNSGSGTITCKTYSGNTLIGTSSCSFSVNVVNSNPTIGAFTYKDNKTATTQITQNNQRIIRNNSNLLFTIGNATAYNSATISKYEVTFNNVTKSRTSAGDLEFGVINLSNNSTATLKVTDSRGNTVSKNITVVIDDWVLPTASVSLNRKNNFYSEAYLKVDGACSYLNGKNSLTIQYTVTKVGASSAYASGNLQDNVQITLNLDNNYQWKIQITVKDLLGQTTYNLLLDRGMPLIYFDRHKSSVGVNCFPSGSNGLYVNNEQVTSGVKSYSNLTNRPVLNTNNSSALGVNGSETINGTISLHKVSKTGNYNDLLNKPTIPTIPTIPTKTSQLTNNSGYINTSASSKAQNGYFKLSNGLIVQWGTCSTGSAVTMPTSFSSASSFAIVGTDSAQGASATINIVVNSANKFTAYAKYGSTYYTDTIRWIAIGY